ncbi:MAG: hypothetical protein R3B70_29855 [Polyangiaceae bacterium]
MPISSPSRQEVLTPPSSPPLQRSLSRRPPRNLTDEARIIGETGGIAGLNFHTPFVSTKRDVTLDDVVLSSSTW